MSFLNQFGTGLSRGLRRTAEDFNPAIRQDRLIEEKRADERKTMIQKVLLQGIKDGSINQDEAVPALKKLGLSDFVIQDQIASSAPPQALEQVGGGAPQPSEAFEIRERSLLGQPSATKAQETRLTKLQIARDRLLAKPQTQNVQNKVTEINQQIKKMGMITGRTPQDVLNLKEITTLSEVGGQVEQFTDLVKGFKPGFGGWGLQVVGDVVNFAKRKFGDESGQALWWQKYNSMQNTVRHKLFGSALTKTEEIAWNKTIINPGDDQSVIRANLAEQTKIARRAANKIANSLKAKGKTVSQIKAALGGAVQFLDIGATTRPAIQAKPPAEMSDEELLEL